MEREGRRGGGGRRGKGRGGGGRGGRGGGGQSSATADQGHEDGERNKDLTEITDEFDNIVTQRNIKGDDDGEEYRQEEIDDDDEEDDKPGERMTTQFKWEEDMEEEFNEAGERMEPFNLKGEREEGYFDKTGNFVWRKEEGKADAWLGALDTEEDMEAMIGEAAAAKRKREEEEARSAEADAAINPDDVKAQALQLMKPGESVLQALKRLGPKREPQKSGGGRAAVLKTVDTRTPEEKAQFDQLTECADRLLRFGMPEIYELSYAELQRAGGTVRSGGAKKRPAAAMAEQSDDSSAIHPPKQVVRWQYKGEDGQIHGPFSTAEILSWRAQGYFTGPTAVSMRFYKGEQGSGKPADTSEEPPHKKKVTFSDEVSSFNADALAADFDDDDDEGPTGGSGSNKQKEASDSSNPWVGSDNINFALYG